MQETQTIAQPQIATKAITSEPIQFTTSVATTPLDEDKARTELNNLGVWADDDINPKDDFMDNKEYRSRIENIVVNVKFLRKVTVDGVSFLSNIYVDQNKIDPKLINLQISIAFDEFAIDGVYDVSVLKKSLFDISHNLPQSTLDDPYKNVRQKAEQLLIEENLIENLSGVKKTDDKAALLEQGELVEEFIKQANPKHKKFSKFKKFSDGIKRGIELLT
ncbi:MAG: hypothetical protein WCP03_00055 [Candidatus Saccharibacteria bacterium]